MVVVLVILMIVFFCNYGKAILQEFIYAKTYDGGYAIFEHICVSC